MVFALTKAGIRKIRLHGMRHTFGSLPIQGGAPLTYVRDQIGHYSIQVTADIYGHLVAGADVRYVDHLDVVPGRGCCHYSASGRKQDTNAPA